VGDSIKEEINIMKPKQIFNSILAVLFVFPLMGTFAQQAPNSGSSGVTTEKVLSCARFGLMERPGTGSLTSRH
jgi:hypothetical protein